MTLTREELRKLLLPGLAALALLAAGAGLVWGAQQSVRSAQLRLAAAEADRKESTERLTRIAEEEREVKEKLDVYQQLKQLNILGEEHRLEWADAITRIRNQRELLDLRYRVDRQKLLISAQGKPANVDFYASTMKVELALLHEEDLLRFLADLRVAHRGGECLPRAGIRPSVLHAGAARRARRQAQGARAGQAGRSADRRFAHYAARWLCGPLRGALHGLGER